MLDSFLAWILVIAGAAIFIPIPIVMVRYIKKIQVQKAEANTRIASTLDDLKKQYHPLACMLCIHINGISSILPNQSVLLLACMNTLTIQSESNPPIIINLNYAKITLVTEFIGENSTEFVRIDYQSDHGTEILCFSYSGIGIKAFNQHASEFFDSDFITALNHKIPPSIAAADTKLLKDGDVFNYTHPKSASEDSMPVLPQQRMVVCPGCGSRSYVGSGGGKCEYCGSVL